MITLDPRQKTISQIAFARTVAFILEASNRSKITLHTAKPRNRVQLVMNNTAEELPAAKKIALCNGVSRARMACCR